MVADFKRKQNNPLGKFFIILEGLLILLVMVSLVIANIRIYQKREKLISQIEILKNKIQGTKNKNNDLKENILRANDDQYTEKIAREELDLQKPGEKVFSFIKESNHQQEDNQGNKNFLQDWIGDIWQWIKNIF